MTFKPHILPSLLVGATLLFSGTALAESKVIASDVTVLPTQTEIVIIKHDRDYLSEYLIKNYHTACPPAIADKDPSCKPGAMTKKRYVVGSPLADDVGFTPVPADVLVHLSPVPDGHEYVYVDRDILLIRNASKRVIDAVPLVIVTGN